MLESIALWRGSLSLPLHKTIDLWTNAHETLSKTEHKLNLLIGLMGAYMGYDNTCMHTTVQYQRRHLHFKNRDILDTMELLPDGR